MEGLFLVVFQHRRVSSMDMKHAVTVSYLNMSLGGKVRQQLTDVLQPAWPLKHISMLMDVRCSFKKKTQFALDFWAHSRLQFSKLILYASQMEQENADHKQVKMIEGRGEQECSWVRAQRLLSPTNLPVWPISSSWDGGLEGQSVVFYKWKLWKKWVSLSEMETGNELQLCWEYGTAVQGQEMV